MDGWSILTLGFVAWVGLSWARYLRPREPKVDTNLWVTKDRYEKLAAASLRLAIFTDLITYDLGPTANATLERLIGKYGKGAIDHFFEHDQNMARAAFNVRSLTIGMAALNAAVTRTPPDMMDAGGTGEAAHYLDASMAAALQVYCAGMARLPWDQTGELSEDQRALFNYTRIRAGHEAPLYVNGDPRLGENSVPVQTYLALERLADLMVSDMTALEEAAEDARAGLTGLTEHVQANPSGAPAEPVRRKRKRGDQ